MRFVFDLVEVIVGDEDESEEKLGNLTYRQTFWRFASCLSVSDEVLELLQNGHCVRVMARNGGCKILSTQATFEAC